jgi:putative endonuclease
MSRERRLLGQAGEALAADTLQQQGYTILTRNYRTPYGEIDLIARHADTLVFVEVKLRRSEVFGSPQEAVNTAKQRHLQLAAQYYLNQQRLGEIKIRFDVVAITLSGTLPRIEIFREAIGG